MDKEPSPYQCWPGSGLAHLGLSGPVDQSLFEKTQFPLPSHHHHPHPFCHTRLRQVKQLNTSKSSTALWEICF